MVSKDCVLLQLEIAMGNPQVTELSGDTFLNPHSLFELLDPTLLPVMFLYHRSTPSPSPSISWHSCRCKQLSITLPNVCFVPSRFHFPSFPTIIHHCYHSPQPILCQRTSSPHLMSMDFITTPLYHMDSACSEQPCMELLPRWLISPYVCFTLPHVCFMYHMGTSVLLFFYLTSLVPLVTYLFHLLLFKRQVLICLSQFEIST